MNMSVLITSVKLSITCTIMLVTCLLAQDRGGTPPGDGRILLGGVFSKAHASGSLEYRGVCNFRRFYPDFPKIRAVPNHEGSPVELLREMFSVDPEMRVSQDADGTIRMIEEDVPSDLLDLKIHQLTWLAGFHGPNMAITAIMKTPEVIAFRKDHNLGPAAEWTTSFSWTGDALASGKPSLTGSLHDVTVRQALDYLLQTFHGFWLYENCNNPEGGRLMHVEFLEDAPLRSSSATPEER
jgi:hypothetical protein